MKPFQTVKGRALKDVDSRSQALVFNNFVKVFLLIAVPGWAVGGILGAAAAALVSLTAAVFAAAVAGSVAVASVNLIYGLGRRTTGLRDELAAPLSEARFHKMNGNFEDALMKVDTVLARDPCFAEALLLKAQVLHEAFDDRRGAKDCLLKLFQAKNDSDACFRRWGKSLYRQIVQREKEQRAGQGSLSGECD